MIFIVLIKVKPSLYLKKLVYAKILPLVKAFRHVVLQGIEVYISNVVI